jgi:hypothetical protein
MTTAQEILPVLGAGAGLLTLAVYYLTRGRRRGGGGPR